MGIGTGKKEKRRRERARDVFIALKGAEGPQVAMEEAIWDSSGPKLGLRRALEQKNSSTPEALDESGATTGKVMRQFCE